MSELTPLTDEALNTLRGDFAQKRHQPSGHERGDRRRHRQGGSQL